MGFEDLCNTDLSLGFINNLNKPDHQYLFQSHHHHHHQQHKNKKTQPKFEFPSLTLGLSSDHQTNQDPSSKIQFFSKSNGESTVLYRQAGSSMSTGVSSYSNSSSVKKERETSEEEEVEREKMINSKMSDEDEEHSARKKLRLTKEQSVILEDSFKEHTTLNPNQKQALAKHLNLRPRQVEVWFQNRRARTKLKQTEVDYELLKKCCETLTDENRRLHKELQDLKALKLTAPFCMKLPGATLTMCPSCERISSSSGGDQNQNSSQNKFPITSNPQFYNPFTYPSAAC